MRLAMQLPFLSVCCASMLGTPAACESWDPLPGHPRIMLLAGEEAAVRAAATSDAALGRVHDAILTESVSMLAKPPLARLLTGRRLLSVSREAIRRIFFLAYAWRMTGDARFSRRAEQEMLAVASFEDWHPEHFLDVAEIAAAMAIGYDWLYDALPRASRDTIRRAILEKGINPSLVRKNTSWLQASHNWNQVCNAGMSLAALAVYEDEPDLARRVIERAAQSMRRPLAEYEPDGAYPEGYGYWGYGTTYQVLFLSAVEKALGTDFGLASGPGFARTAAYLLHMSGPSGQAFNYSDSGAGGALNPAMFWFAARSGDTSLLHAELGHLSDARAMVRNRVLPALMVWASGLRLDSAPEPASRSWVGRGTTPVALFRSSWRPDALYVAVKGGSASTNHAHMDAGSFVVDWGGLRWAMDFGPQDYNSLESKGVDLWNRKQDSQRWEVFRYGNAVHNTLTVNGEHHRVNGHATITRSSTDPRFTFAELDLSEVFQGELGSARRGVAIVDGSYVVLRDEVQTTARGARVRWAMLTPASVTIQPDGSARLTQGGKAVVVRAVEPGGLHLTTWSTAPVHDYDAPNPGTTLFGFEVDLARRSSHALTVLLLPEGTEARPVPPLEEWQ